MKTTRTWDVRTASGRSIRPFTEQEGGKVAAFRYAREDATGFPGRKVVERIVTEREAVLWEDIPEKEPTP